MYLVTTEDEEDGHFWHPPVGFDSEEEARKWIAEAGDPDDGIYVLYYCREIEAFHLSEDVKEDAH